MTEVVKDHRSHKSACMNDFTCMLKYTTDKLQQLWFCPINCLPVFAILQCQFIQPFQQTGVVSASDCISNRYISKP